MSRSKSAVLKKREKRRMRGKWLPLKLRITSWLARELAKAKRKVVR